MHWINVGLIFIAGLDIGMAFVIWLKNIKNKINISFALSFFLAGLWTFSVGLFREANTIFSIIFWGWIQDYAGALSLIPLLYFSLYYPYQHRKQKIFELIIIAIYFIGVTFIVFVPNKWFGGPYFIDPPNSGYTVKNGYLFFILFYFYFAISILVNLIYKLKKNITLNRLQDVTVIVSLFVILFVAGFVSVIWPYVNPAWRYWHWIGSYSALVTLSLIGFLLLRRK